MEPVFRIFRYLAKWSLMTAPFAHSCTFKIVCRPQIHGFLTLPLCHNSYATYSSLPVCSMRGPVAMLAFSKSVLQRLDKPAQPLALHRVRLPPLSSRDAAATPCSRSRARAILTRWQRRAGVEALVVNHIQLLLKTCLICKQS